MMRQRWTVVGGVVLGLLLLTVAGRADDAAVVKAVEKLGGKVTVDVKRPGKPIVGVDLKGARITDAELKELKDLKELRELNLFGTPVTDAGLKELKDLKNLQTLSLSYTPVTDAGLEELKALKRL